MGRGFGVGGRVGSGVGAGVGSIVGEGVSGTSVGIGVAVGVSLGAGRDVVTQALSKTAKTRAATPTFRLITVLAYGPPPTVTGLMPHPSESYRVVMFATRRLTS